MKKLALAALVLCPVAASAFCGFYVSSAGASLFNDASSVVLLREGTRTVLSMQNNYRGPPENFALVVPVPVVLKKEMVKTLPKGVFDRVDTLGSPRLVEDFEPGPCPEVKTSRSRSAAPSVKGGLPEDLGVKVEAKFEVGEYEIVILSAKDALGLDIWLKENKYKIPAGMESALKPYVAGGWKFFVARVDVKKVQLVDGQAVLSPLRFHYDSEKFELPVRLGLMNSAGEQDLIVTIAAKGRYELANLKNVPVPSNVQLTEAAMPKFGAIYADILARTFKQNPGAAITEFAWKGALPPPKVMSTQGIYGVTCDPCPPPMPIDDPLAKLLGVDVLPEVKTDEDVAKWANGATLTRLHLRYTKESLTDDLVFKLGEPIAGGIPEQLKTGPAKENRFQARYIVKRPFNPDVCWRYQGARGKGFGGGAVAPMGFNALLAGQGGKQAAAAKLDVPLESLLKSDISELGLKAAAVKK